MSSWRGSSVRILCTRVPHSEASKRNLCNEYMLSIDFPQQSAAFLLGRLVLCAGSFQSPMECQRGRNCLLSRELTLSDLSPSVPGWLNPQTATQQVLKPR